MIDVNVVSEQVTLVPSLRRYQSCPQVNFALLKKKNQTISQTRLCWAIFSPRLLIVCVAFILLFAVKCIKPLKVQIGFCLHKAAAQQTQICQVMI